MSFFWLVRGGAKKQGILGPMFFVLIVSRGHSRELG